MSSTGRPTYPALDGLRIYAALLVFLVHLFGGILTEYYRIPESELSVLSPVGGIATMMFLADGHHGVDIFFLISGFLMARIARPGMSWSGFVKRRWLRIYPAFLASLLLSTVVLVTLFDWPFQWRDFALNLVFYNSLPGHGILPYNHVTWTLGYEFAFYLAVPLLALPRAPWLRFMLAGVAVVASLTLLYGTPVRLAGLFAGFMLGCASDEQLRNVARRVPILVPVVAYCALVWAKSFLPLDFATFHRILLPVAALLIVCITFGGHALNRFFASPAMRRLGQWSYSIYLIHPIVLAVVMTQLLDMTGGRQNPVFAIPFICIVSIVATVSLAALSYKLFEAPYFRGRRGLRADSGRVVTPASGAP